MAPGSLLGPLLSQVDEVKNIMVDNIEKVLERGEKIELLVDKTDNLRFQVGGVLRVWAGCWRRVPGSTCALGWGAWQAVSEWEDQPAVWKQCGLAALVLCSACQQVAVKVKAAACQHPAACWPPANFSGDVAQPFI